MLDQGRYEDATVLFEEILSEQPDNLGALRGMVMTSINQKDTVTLQKYADMQVETLIGKKAFDHLWEMYGLIKKNFPDFSFNPENQMMLARWLSHKGMDVETAKVLRELAVKHPEDPAAPKALFQCAEILWKKCGKPEASVSMFEYLLKRYPDGAFIDRANQALLDIKSGG